MTQYTIELRSAGSAASLELAVESALTGGSQPTQPPQGKNITLNRQFFNERRLASLLKTTVLFRNVHGRMTRTLKGLEALAHAVA